MLDLPTLRRIQLSPRPFWQRFIAKLLVVDYWRTAIDVEGFERVPDEPVIFAMNHTDRYNYWPFQLKLYQQLDRFTATWVKGKYYEKRLVRYFMEKTNNLPTVSRGYVITRDMLSTLGRRPSDEEYTALRGWVDGAAHGDRRDAPSQCPQELLTTPRAILGRPFDPQRERYPDAINGVFAEMMGTFLELHLEAFGMGLDLLVFPQGTRSRRLSKGRPGLAQVALHFKKTVVPVGCSGCDEVYPGGSPFAKSGGHIVYRIGEPIRYEDVARFHIDDPFVPFSAPAEIAHRDIFQGYVDGVMDRVNGLLDPPYRFSADGGDTDDSGGVTGVDRFV